MEIEPATLAQVRKGRDGRLIAIDDDVLGIARQIRDIDPSLHLRYNEAGEYFVVYQDFGDSQVLVTTSKTCDQRLLRRVEVISRPDYDFVKEADQMDKTAKARRDAEFHAAVAERSERLAHAIRKDLGYKRDL